MNFVKHHVHMYVITIVVHMDDAITIGVHMFGCCPLVYKSYKMLTISNEK